MTSESDRHSARPAGSIRHPPSASHPTAKPWFKEPWPWILMAGPAAVVVAGAVTIWLAFQSADGLVADDYYRRGLTINQELQRDRAAASDGAVRGARRLYRIPPGSTKLAPLSAWSRSPCFPSLR